LTRDWARVQQEINQSSGLLEKEVLLQLGLGSFAWRQRSDDMHGLACSLATVTSVTGLPG
jgi:hypothetical protein